MEAQERGGDDGHGRHGNVDTESAGIARRGRGGIEVGGVDLADVAETVDDGQSRSSFGSRTRKNWR